MDQHASTLEMCWERIQKILIVKIVVDCSLVELAKANLLNLCDIDMIFGLPWGKTQSKGPPK
jgi:hypothetical protein